METMIHSVLLQIAFVFFSGANVPEWEPNVVSTIGSTQEVTCLAVTEDGLWAGTLGAGMICRQEAGPTRSFGSTDGLPGNRVRDCRVVADVLWVATDMGLARFDTQSDWFETVAWGRFLRLASSGDSLLAARDDGRVLKARPGREPVPLLRRRRLEMVPLSLAGGPDGRWAAGSVDGRVYLAREGRYLNVGRPVISLAYARDRLMALTPEKGYCLVEGGFQQEVSLDGAVLLDEEGRPVRTPGLQALQVSAAVVWGDRLVVGTDEGAFVESVEREEAAAAWSMLSLGGSPCGPRLSSVTSFNGALWVGSFDNGLCRFDGRRWTHFSGPEHLPSDMVNHMEATRRHLYVGTLKGLTVVDRDGTLTQYTKEQCIDNTKADCPWHSSVTGISIDRVRHKPWVADTGSVHRLGSRGWKHYFKRRGLASSRITRIAVRDGLVAIGTSDIGIQLKRPGHDFETVDDQQGLADNWVMDLEFDRSGALWVGTCTRGVSRLFEGEWRSWTTADGLADDYILSVTEIEGRIWVGTFRGMSILTERGIVNLSAEDGLAGNEVHDTTMHEGKVYLATDGGLTVIELTSPKRLAEVLP